MQDNPFSDIVAKEIAMIDKQMEEIRRKKVQYRINQHNLKIAKIRQKRKTRQK